jgi:Rieske Fe-S protein
MAMCDVCGNDYDQAFTITRGEHSGTYDSFECAISAMAPVCAHCGCKVIGHGMESTGTMFCCAHCARHSGEVSLTDRV